MEETTPTGTQTAAPQSRKKKNNLVLGGLGGLLALALLFLGLEYFGKTNILPEGVLPQRISLPYDPDEVVATVNGTTINRGEFEKRFEQVQSVFAAQGSQAQTEEAKQQVRTQIVEEMVNTKLLLQAAQKGNFKATDEAIEAKFQELTSYIGSEEALDAQLKEINLTREELRQNITDQIVIQEYLKANTTIDTVEVTDAELKAFYDTSLAGSENAPSLEDQGVKEFIREQVKSQKSNEIVNQHVAQLRQSAQVEIKI